MSFNDFSWLSAKPEILIKVFFLKVVFFTSERAGSILFSCSRGDCEAVKKVCWKLKHK